MIWLYVIIPILILIIIAVITEKKNKGWNSPLDANKGNHNMEAETNMYQLNNQQYGDSGGGDSGSLN
ncbi:hypothetical protein FIU87_04825 [Bacillus sp. THAF10]|uniref:hypothetical protein n=1 Tax=Bacillus sp. THAF10 TaxID=2587848 RepID=UPI00126856B5|nr:hypothetical protein [Bacillus sp. THAF10]QFT87973.1 hypothetical protein FIU87_04825 [Bacillus sp. THAF10]